jgi:transposase
VQGRHPLQTSNALGAAAAQVGPHVVALATVLNKQLGLSLGKVATLLRERFGLSLTCGGLVHAMRRAARCATPTYQALLAQVRGSPVVAPDETGWKVAGQLHWLWAFATPDTTVYAIQRGRGFEEAAAVLGADFDGALVRDGWSPYRQFTAAVHQSCLAHLLRRCRALERDHDDHRFAPQIAALLQHGLQVRDRWRLGAISDRGVAIARGLLDGRMLRLLDTPRLRPPAERFARHLDLEFGGLFSFLLDLDIDATNWRAEQAIRPAVVNRKVWGGNRTTAGAATQQVLTSVLRTTHLRQLDASDVLVEMLRSPIPVVPLALAHRPAGTVKALN